MVGDAVLLVVVGADLLAATAAADLRLAARAESSAACASCSACSSRARSTCMARARFWSWLRSSCMATTMPVGLWVMRTAESVVFTLWPPGPDERYTSICRSFGSIVDVDLVGLGQHGDGGRRGVDPPLRSRSPAPAGPGAARPRTSGGSSASSPLTTKVIWLKPPRSDGSADSTSSFQPMRGRRRPAYISNRSRAKRLASSPPSAPRISTMTSLPSFGSAAGAAPAAPRRARRGRPRPPRPRRASSSRSSPVASPQQLPGRAEVVLAVAVAAVGRHQRRQLLVAPVEVAQVGAVGDHVGIGELRLDRRYSCSRSCSRSNIVPQARARARVPSRCAPREARPRTVRRRLGPDGRGGPPAAAAPGDRHRW